jgi:hypothetical protein
MTAYFSLGTIHPKRIRVLLRPGPLAIRDMFATIGAKWRAELAAGQLGSDPETVIGRGTGARV